MSHIERKLVEERVMYLYTLPLCIMLATHNWQIIIGETSNWKRVHAYKYTHIHIHKHAHAYSDTCTGICIHVHAYTHINLYMHNAMSKTKM